MASPHSGTPVAPHGEPRSPGSRVLQILSRSPSSSSLADEAIWKRLREAGFDEEMIKRRDKAALISYIAKLEAEMHEYQHHMGLLILERKEWTSKYEQLKSSTDSAEIVYKRDHAAHISALAEARKCEESLKKAFGIEKECVANLEKALHEMRTESAEAKVSAESKLAEAHIMVENAQKKFDEAGSKLRAAESLQAEASRYDRSVTRKLQEVEAREDELRRRHILYKSECDAKERDLNLARQSLYDSQKILQQEQDKLLEGQAFLNEREEYIFAKSQELSRDEKGLEIAKANLDRELMALQEERSNLALDKATIENREEACIKKESFLNKREKELLILQEMLASREHEEIQRLSAEHQLSLERRKSEFEDELAHQKKSLEDEMEARRLSCERREVTILHREEVIQERESALELQLKFLAEKEVDTSQTLKLLDEKEQNIVAARNVAEKEMLDLHKKREEIERMKLDLEKVQSSAEDEKTQLIRAQEKLEITVAERNELFVLQRKLKEEIDSFRAQQLELYTEADKLKEEKEKFEKEWELIDEKREELNREAERVAEERKSVCKYLKNERDSLKLEKEALNNQFKKDVESLSLEREDFIVKMEREYSDWFIKIQREREDFGEDIEIQKRELESCISKRREEIESYLREREEALEDEKAKEFQQISSQKEMAAKELEHVASEMRRLDMERMEILKDREQREKEWLEIKNSIVELNTQREKLEKQRELLHADREEIYAQAQHLKELENLKIALEDKALTEIKVHTGNTNKWKVPLRKCSGIQTAIQDSDEDPKMAANGGFGQGQLSERKLDGASPPMSLTLSWVRKCAERILKRSPEKIVEADYNKNLESKACSQYGVMFAGCEFESPTSHALEHKYTVNDKRIVMSKQGTFQDTAGMSEGIKSRGRVRTGRREAVCSRSDLEEPKVILEVPSSGLNVEKTHDMEHKNSIETSNIVPLKRSSFQDMNGETSSTDSGVNALQVGRKRLKSLLSHGNTDVCVEPSQKYQKRMRPNKVSNGASTAEITSNGMVSMHMPFSEGDNGLKSVGQISEGREMSGACLDEVHEASSVCKQIRCTGATGEQAEVSEGGTSLLQHENIENGRSHGNGRLPSHCQEILMTQEKELDTISLEAEKKLSKQSSMSPAKLIAYLGDKLKKLNESNRENIDEADEEVEEESSVKEKLWNFLIT